MVTKGLQRCTYFQSIKCTPLRVIFTVLQNDDSKFNMRSCSQVVVFVRQILMSIKSIFSFYKLLLK